MKLSAKICIPAGIAIIAAPWIWAWMEVRANPSVADDQGAWSMATYATFIMLPLGIVLICSRRRR